MSSSGAMSTSNQYVKYKITITTNSQNMIENYSNVTVTVRFYRTNSGYTTYGSGTCYCKINGTTYSASVSPSQKITNSGINLFSKTLNIYHNTDGSKLLNTSAWINLNTPLTSSEQSYNENLNVIPRATLLDSFTCSTTYLNGIFTYEYTPQASSFYNRLRISIVNVAVLEYIELGQKSIGQHTGTCSLSVNSLTACYESYTGAINCKIGVVIETYSDEEYTELIGESIELIQTLTFPESVVPSINSVSLSEAVSGIYAQFGAYVQGKSKIAGSISASGVYGSSINSYSTSINGASYTSNSFTTDFLLTSGSNTCSVTVTDSRNRIASTTRSFTVISYSNPVINSFSVSRCNSDGTANDEGNCAKCVISATISSVNSRNTKTFQILYKKLSEVSWSTLNLDNTNYSINTTQIIQNIDTESEYNFRAVATDFFSSAEYPHNLSTAYTIMDFRSTGKGLAIGKVSTIDALEINMDTNIKGTCELTGNEILNGNLTLNGNAILEGSFRLNGNTIFELIYPIGSIYMSVNNINPSTLFGGTWALWGSGRVPVCVDISDSNFNTAEKTGGSKTHRHEWQIGMHWWYGSAAGENSSDGTGAYRFSNNQYDGWNRTLTSKNVTVNNSNTSGGTSKSSAGKISIGDTELSSSLQPYITCYMWKRIT